MPREARKSLCMLTWREIEGGWELDASTPLDIAGADFEFEVGPQSDAEFVGIGEFAAHREGDNVRVAVARMPQNDEPLIRIIGMMSSPPQVVEVSLNEGEIEAHVARPARFELSQNAPNPFNPSTTIRYGVPHDGDVSLVIYDATGRFVRELVNRSIPVGFHMVIWDGRDNAGREMGSGVYLYRLQWQASASPDGDATSKRVRETTVRRMVLVR